MLYFKTCPKCETGTVEHNSDPWGGYLQCLNCGFMRDVSQDVDVVSELRRLHAELASVREEPVEQASPRRRKRFVSPVLVRVVIQHATVLSFRLSLANPAVVRSPPILTQVRSIASGFLSLRRRSPIVGLPG
jgi:hypothetical protein